MKKCLIILLLMVMCCENHLQGMDLSRFFEALEQQWHLQRNCRPEAQQQLELLDERVLLQRENEQRLAIQRWQEEQERQQWQRWLEDQRWRGERQEERERDEQRLRREAMLEKREIVKYQKKTYSKYHSAQTRGKQYNARINQPRENNYKR